MIILIWTLASICFALMCGCIRLMDKNKNLEIAYLELWTATRGKFEYAKPTSEELISLEKLRDKIQFDEESA
jgi:hypothetical protein